MDTIHGFQGDERDIIIVSTVRSNNSLNLGFLENHPKQLNVALTRTKSALFIVGNTQVLRSCPYWEKFLQYLNTHAAIFTTLTMENILEFIPYDLNSEPIKPQVCFFFN